MENSRKSSCDLVERVADALSPVLPAGSSVLLALSGGVDSVVLLHLLHQLAPRYSWRLSALHVHHGISPHADAWAAFCTDLCARYEIPFLVEHVDIAPLREHGIEAAARKLRHAALDRQPVAFIALAHHQDDQAETLLLQLLRGAGLRGVSAMPVIRSRTDHPTQLRPLLNVARSELLAYAQQHALQWVEDESNADDAYPRNFLRHRMLPLLEQRFPAYRETLTRSARHFAEASELLDQLAQQDTQGALQDGGLEVARLQALSFSRAKNLLRYFLHSLGAPMPQAVQLDGMLQQLCGARQGAAVQLTFGNWQLRRYQGKAYAFPTLPEPDAEFCAQWLGETALELPELGGALHFEPAIGHGLSLEKLHQHTVTVRLRHGAERIRLDDKRPTRTLKNLLQEQGIPPWQRDRLPLLFCGETLIAIPGIGVDCAYQVESDEAGVVLRWSVAI
jgi:tRNA(Ile)-lysidine synthase